MGYSQLVATQRITNHKARVMLETGVSGVTLFTNRCRIASEEQMRRLFQC